jgi:hypothetical protein
LSGRYGEQHDGASRCARSRACRRPAGLGEPRRIRADHHDRRRLGFRRRHGERRLPAGRHDSRFDHAQPLDDAVHDNGGHVDHTVLELVELHRHRLPRHIRAGHARDHDADRADDDHAGG